MLTTISTPPAEYKFLTKISFSPPYSGLCRSLPSEDNIKTRQKAHMRDLFGFKSLTLLNKIFSRAFEYFRGLWWSNVSYNVSLKSQISSLINIKAHSRVSCLFQLSSNFETREKLCGEQWAGEAEEVKYVLWEIFDAVEKSKGRNPHHTEPLSCII